MTATPTAPPDLPERPPHPDELPRRKPLPWWDRVKYLVLLTIVWFVLVWARMADNPILPFVDAMRLQLQDGAWVLWLAGIELLRQVHYLISEHWSAYHLFWTRRVFGGTERLLHRRLSDWTRFRLGRAIKFVLWIVLIAVVLGEVLDTSPVLALFELPAIIWAALPFVAQLIFILAIVVLQFVAIFWFLSRGGVDVYYPDDIKTRFSDVWGQDHVLARVRENIVFLEDPERIEAKGGYVPGGLLLWGPPGTGKTLMAEAVAGETGRPYVFVDPGAFINMFMGIGVLKVKSLFRKLRKLALRYGGVIVFFDEADSLGRRGALAQGGPGGVGRGMGHAAFSSAGCQGFSYLSEHSKWMLARGALGGGAEPAPASERRRFIMGGAGGGGDGGMGTLQALLTEISGLKKPRGLVNRYVRRALGMRPKPPPKYRILIMMATNMPEALDEALLRPGRIDRIYRVGYPTKAGRIRTYQGYFAKVENEITEEQLDKLATITPYATGASIKDLVNESLITTIRDGRDVITWRDVMKAKQLKDLGPPEDVEYIERERHAVAVHEGCHAVVAYRMRQHMEIDIATIEKGSDYLGMVASIPPEDQFTRWRSEYETDILVSLASLAGERMFFDGDSSSGVSGDLESATTIAVAMEGVWGMGQTVSSYQTARRLEVGSPGGRGIAGEDQPNAREALADRIEDKLAELLDRVGAILKDNRRAVLALAHALETHKTLTGEDVEAVIDGRPGPTIDGSIYAEPEFAARLEEYHAAAAGAHHSHAGVLVAIPTVPSYRSDGLRPSNGVDGSGRPDGSGQANGSDGQGGAAPVSDTGTPRDGSGPTG